VVWAARGAGKGTTRMRMMTMLDVVVMSVTYPDWEES
jgi:hypothetical protein